MKKYKIIKSNNTIKIYSFIGDVFSVIGLILGQVVGCCLLGVNLDTCIHVGIGLVCGYVVKAVLR